MSKKIKVMQLVWRLSTGGAERMVVNFHNSLKDNPQIEVRTLSFTPQSNDLYESQIVKDSSVAFIPKHFSEKLPSVIGKAVRKLVYPKFRKKWLISQVEEFSPDILHIHLAGIAAEMYDVCRKLPKSIKIIYHLHSMPEAIGDDRRRIIRRAVEEKVYTPLCVTQLQRESAVSFYGIDENADIVYNGIDIKPFLECEMTDSDKQELKKSLGIDEDALVVGCVGRGAEIKNYPKLAAAVGELSKSRKTAFLVVGKIPKELADDIYNNAKNATVVLTGQRSDTNRLYRIMDVFALASFYESSSIVTVEAQLSGVPCVISDRISDEVIISDAVMKCSPDASEKEWAEKISQSAGKTAVLSENYRRFDFNESVKELIRIYSSLTDAEL